MATKKNYDSKFVSGQPHEIKYISTLFKITDGSNLTELAVFFMLELMSYNFKRVPRANLYKALSAMGCKKAK